MIDVDQLSPSYSVRKLTESDIGAIYRLCRENTIFYQYCAAELSREQILLDLHITPPGIREDRKFYVGFSLDEKLIAVMDLIDGFPREDTGYIGFFMVSVSHQGLGLGSKIITDTSRYLKRIGKRAIRLGIDKDNPQSASFWKKNGFQVLKEHEQNDGRILLLAEKRLDDHLPFE